MASIVLRVHVLSNNDSVDDRASDALTPTERGIALGRSSAIFQGLNDPLLDEAHGTLERTAAMGVWVYSDHSASGSAVNGTRLHRDAAVVRNGDRLLLGQTEIELCMSKSEAQPQDEEHPSPLKSNQERERHIQSSARLSRRRASTPWASASKAQQAKQRLPRIETSGLGFVPPLPFAAVQPTAAPPEYTASPIPGARWRRKRNSIATSTLTAQRSPSPPLEQHAQPHSAFHRPRTRFIQGSDLPLTPPRLDSAFVAELPEKVARPPPLEYSSSPVASPSAITARQRHNLFQQPPTSVPVPGIALASNVPPAPFSAGARPTSRRDDLRIQVSKKMAAAAPVSAGKTAVPLIVPKVLEFQAPASPVAQRDIKRQQESLQTILQHKFEEEQLLKQQQEEWMREHSMPASAPATDSSYRLGSPTSLSPIKSVDAGRRKSIADIDPDELAFFPVQAPVLLRTISLGLSEQRAIKPSPRLTAAIRASRSRLNSFEERSSEPSTPRASQRDGKWRRRSAELTRSPTSLPQSNRRSSQTKLDELRASDESVSSSATTVITCHRRVTTSLSSSSGSARSVDLGDFLGYEDDEDIADAVTSYTTPDLYASAELMRRSRDDTTLLFDKNRNSASSLYGSSSPPLSTTSSSSTTVTYSAGAPLESPSRLESDKLNSAGSLSSVKSDHEPRSNNSAPDLDEVAPLAGARVWSPRGGQFDPQSPYKSTAAIKNHQQPQVQKLRRPPPEPEDGEDGDHQLSHQSFRRRPSFRRHAPSPLKGNN